MTHPVHSFIFQDFFYLLVPKIEICLKYFLDKNLRNSQCDIYASSGRTHSLSDHCTVLCAIEAALSQLRPRFHTGLKTKINLIYKATVLIHQVLHTVMCKKVHAHDCTSKAKPFEFLVAYDQTDSCRVHQRRSVVWEKMFIFCFRDVNIFLLQECKRLTNLQGCKRLRDVNVSELLCSLTVQCLTFVGTERIFIVKAVSDLNWKNVGRPKKGNQFLTSKVNSQSEICLSFKIFKICRFGLATNFKTKKILTTQIKVPISTIFLQMVSSFKQFLQPSIKFSLKFGLSEKHTKFEKIFLMVTQCARTDLNKRFLPKPMTTTG